MSIRNKVHALIDDALITLSMDLVADASIQDHAHVVERPRTRSHGDFASNAAMLVARSRGVNPRTIADSLRSTLSTSVLFNSIEIAGPGFINFTIANDALADVIMSIHQQADIFGTNDNGAGQCAGVEFVSANPTGPLHVGHSRGAILGDCISRILAANGWSVTREYYYNDGGVQIQNLANSVQCRIKGITPGARDWPAAAYCGNYIADVAEAYLAGEHVIFEGQVITGSGDGDDLDAIRRFSVAYLRREQEANLLACGVRFDVYFLESSLYTQGQVTEVIDRLGDHGHTFEHDGALWLRSTAFGDDKDRVMRKTDGTYTYFVPDVAYHLSKWQRGYLRAITELGADHHGSLARVRAGLQALDLGIPQGWPEYVLHQMVTVLRNGQEVKLSKRAGSYMTLRDLIDESGRDAVRWYMAARRPDSQLTFDIDLARSQSPDNPVYYVQLSHARICGLFRQLADRALVWNGSNASCLHDELEHASARAVALALAHYPDVIASAADALEPHQLTSYLVELAQQFQSYYNDHHFLVEQAHVRDARLSIAAATRQVIANGLALLGISAPEEM